MPIRSAEDWFKGLGPITKYSFMISVALTVATHFKYVGVYRLLLDWEKISRSFQLDRLITNLIYFGPPSSSFLFNLVFYVIYQSKLEEHYRGRVADHMAMLLFTSSVMSFLAYLLHISWLSDAMLTMLVWVWCRTNEETVVSFLGLPMPAPYFPWLLFFVHFTLGGELCT